MLRLRFRDRQRAKPVKPNAARRDEGGGLEGHAGSGTRGGHGVAAASSAARSPAQSAGAALLQAPVFRSAAGEAASSERTSGTKVRWAAGAGRAGPEVKAGERSGPEHGRPARAMGARGQVIVGRGGGPGAASSTGVPPEHASSDGIPPPLSVGRGVWSAQASGVASDEARREVWAARASDRGGCDGPEWGQSAGRAGQLSAGVADGGKRGQ